MIVRESREGRLVLKDYLNREVTIAEEDYLNLIAASGRRGVVHCLDECLLEPTEVWWMVEDINGVSYSYYKYFKIYRDLVFIAYVLHNKTMDFELNNFYGFDENNFHEAEKERRGQLIRG
ncbi:MAG TPA: PBECR2 nuclease fold domain-containing protein [Pelobium sp.]|nr:PBECR2 nuclease fold domain-containing protein [Pelobium sp.]